LNIATVMRITQLISYLAWGWVIAYPEPQLGERPATGA